MKQIKRFSRHSKKPKYGSKVCSHCRGPRDNPKDPYCKGCRASYMRASRRANRAVIDRSLLKKHPLAENIEEAKRLELIERYEKGQLRPLSQRKSN